jgi:hypothetical protein
MSNFLSLNKEDFKRIGMGAAVAVTGALLTYLSQVITTIDFGAYTPIIMAVWSVVANIVRKWLTNNEGKFGKADVK